MDGIRVDRAIIKDVIEKEPSVGISTRSHRRGGMPEEIVGNRKGIVHEGAPDSGHRRAGKQIVLQKGRCRIITAEKIVASPEFTILNQNVCVTSNGRIVR